MRVLAGTGEVTITAPLCDQTGEPIASPSEPITAVATRANGDDVPVDGDPSVNASGEAVVMFAPGYMEDLDEITVAVTDDDGRRATVTLELVGGVYASVAAIRASDPSLAAATDYPDELVRQVRGEVEAEFESAQATGVAWVPRFARIVVDARCPIVLPVHAVRRVRWARYAIGPGEWTDVDSEAVAGAHIADNTVTFPAGALGSARWYELGVEHGHDSPPADLLEAFMVRVRDRLNRPSSAIDDRATSYHSGDHTFALSTPGVAGAVTGLPPVDVVLKRYRRRSFGIA